MAATATLSSKYQISVPKAIRDELKEVSRFMNPSCMCVDGKPVRSADQACLQPL